MCFLFMYLDDFLEDKALECYYLDKGGRGGIEVSKSLHGWSDGLAAEKEQERGTLSKSLSSLRLKRKK